jgi:hypothetical protein
MNKTDKKISEKIQAKVNPPKEAIKAKNLPFDDGSKKKKVQ